LEAFSQWVDEGGYAFGTGIDHPGLHGLSANHAQAIIMLLIRPIDADQGRIRCFVV
jgi:hypothetical protein